MIIVNLTGGLGNQMFQYAAARRLALKHKTQLKFHFTNALFCTQRVFSLSCFNIKADIASIDDLRRLGIVENRVTNRLLFLFEQKLRIKFNKKIITEKEQIFDPQILSLPDNVYLQGYWQDERYFKDIENQIRKDFSFSKPVNKINQQLANLISKTNSVSIHVRRGDYITNKTGPKFIGLDYYKNAIKNIEKKVKNSVYFVFSDDIPWCKANLTSLADNIHYVDCNKGKAYKDLLLMSACKHNIIANSSFSWWGGWLNKNLNKIIIKSQ